METMGNRIVIGDSKVNELASFVEMERSPDTREFILADTLENHQRRFRDESIRYKSIYTKGGETIGFMILRLDEDGESVEFLRIVVAKRGQGYGQEAVAMLDEIARDEFKRNRIRLDVFDFNKRGRHIYEKAGYRHISDEQLSGKVLKIMEKRLDG